jgi:hypothetical protein
MLEFVRIDMRDGMPDRRKIVDQRHRADAEFRRDMRGADHPRIVGQLEHVAVNGPRKRDCDRLRQRLAQPLAERRPGVGKAGKLAGLEACDLAEARHGAVADFGQSKPDVGSAHVDRHDLRHCRLSPERRPTDAFVRS